MSSHRLLEDLLAFHIHKGEGEGTHGQMISRKHGPLGGWMGAVLTACDEACLGAMWTWSLFLDRISAALVDDTS